MLELFFKLSDFVEIFEFQNFFFLRGLQLHALTEDVGRLVHLFQFLVPLVIIVFNFLNFSFVNPVFVF